MPHLHLGLEIIHADEINAPAQASFGVEHIGAISLRLPHVLVSSIPAFLAGYVSIRGARSHIDVVMNCQISCRRPGITLIRAQKVEAVDNVTFFTN